MTFLKLSCIENDFVEIFQLRAKFQTVMVSYSRFIWITNFSDRMSA